MAFKDFQIQKKLEHDDLASVQLAAKRVQDKQDEVREWTITDLSRGTIGVRQQTKVNGNELEAKRQLDNMHRKAER